jgi:hypothetical protein
VLVEWFGTTATIAILAGFALFNVALIGVLWAVCRPGSS